MITSNNFNHWLKNQTSSYVDKSLDLNDLIRFDLGECQIDSDQNVRDVLKKINVKDLQTYPDPKAEELKKNIAQSLNLLPSMVTVSNGADELIEVIPQIILNKNDYFIVVTPTFFRFIDASIRQEAKIITISTSSKDGFWINEKIIKRVIKKTNEVNAKLIWLCSPNNPTGQIINDKLIHDVVKTTNAFVVLDQVFNGFANEKENNKILNLIFSNKNLILIRSLSKTHGLASTRIGFGLAHPETIALFEKWRLPFNTSFISQKIAINAIKDKNHLNKVKEIIDKERKFLFGEIKKLQNLTIGSNSKTNIFILKHGTKDLFEELLKRNILTADLRNTNGLEKMGFVRITIQNRDKNLLLLVALKEISQLK